MKASLGVARVIAEVHDLHRLRCTNETLVVEFSDPEAARDFLRLVEVDLGAPAGTLSVNGAAQGLYGMYDGVEFRVKQRA